jgi:hypothetical protein
MARHCTLAFNNPVTGQNHPSLVGYLLNQYGVSEEVVAETLEKGFPYIKSDGVKSWGRETSESPYIEPNILDILSLFKSSIPTELSNYVVQMQQFYNKKNLSLDTELNLGQLKKLMNASIGEGLTLEYEVVNPEAMPSERRYTVYPMPSSEETQYIETTSLFKDYDEYYKELGKPTAVKNITKYVDIVNPNIYNTVRKILTDEATPQYEKDIINVLVKLLDMNQDIEFNLSYDAQFTKNEAGRIIPSLGRYDIFTNRLTLFLGNISELSPDEMRQLLIHEMVHSVLASTLENPQTTAEKVFTSEIRKIWEYYQQKYKDQEPLGNLYGIKDHHEFVSEFLSNPIFRESIVESAPEVHGSIFQSILNFFKKLLGMHYQQVGRRVDSQYVDSLLTDLFENILDNNNLNTTLVYNADYSFNSAANSKNYQQFIETLPGTPGYEVDAFTENLRTFLESDAIDWRVVYQHANQQGFNIYGLESAMDKLNLIVPDDIPVADLQKSFESLLTHLEETTFFLRNLSTGLTNAQRDKSLSPGDLYSRSYHAAKIGEFFLAYTKRFSETLFGMDMPPADTAIVKYLNNIKAISNVLKEQLNEVQAKAVAGKLTQDLYQQTADIRNILEKNIKEFTTKLAKAKTPSEKKQFEKRLKEEKERLNIISSPQNLERALLGLLTVGPKTRTGKLAYQIGSIFESAAISGNLVAGTLDSFINNLWSKSTQEALQFQGAMKNLAERMQAHLASQGVNFTTGLDHNKIFMPFLREVTMVEIVKGKLVERKTLVLQSKMDEVGYMNAWTTKKFAVSQLENKRNRTSEEDAQLETLITDLTNFEEANLQSYYTDEYHRIQSLLSPRAKEMRQAIIDQMRKIQISPIQGENIEEDLDKLDQLKVELDALEQDTDEYGVLKSPEAIEVAQSIRAWKEERSAANLIQYEVSERNLAVFKNRFGSLQEEVAQAIETLDEAMKKSDNAQIQVAQAKLNKAEADLALFKKANVVKKISSQFYEDRADILDAIAEIQKQYRPETQGRTISDIYQELFALLKPYKNKNGEYEGSKVITEYQEYVDENGNVIPMNIPSVIKKLQEEIEAIKSTFDNSAEIAPEDKRALKQLYEQLNEMQERTTTEDYQKATNIQLNIARATLISKNPNYFVGKTEQEANNGIIREMKKSEWYKMNHIKVQQFDANTRQYKSVMVPLFHWQVTLPTNAAYISETEPSFRWYTATVNSEVDPNTGKPKYINPEVKEAYNSKRVALRPDSIYINKSYDNIKGEAKEILEEVIALYESRQKPLPRVLKKGLELPSVRKEGLETAGELSVEGIWDDIKGGVGNIIDSLQGKNEEEDLAEGDSLLGSQSQVNQFKDRLHLKYVKPIDSSQMTKNFFNSITQFGSDAIRFQNLYSNLPYILGARDLVNREEFAGKDSTTARIVNNLLERKINGQGKVTMSNVAILNAVGFTSDKVLGLGANMALSLNLPAAIKNFTAGTTNMYVQLGRFGVSRADIHKAMLKNAGQYMNLLNAELEEGKNTPYMLKMKYFGVMTEDTLTAGGKKIFVSTLNKSAKYNPLKHLTFFRQFGEFEMRSAVAEVLSKQHLVKLNNGSYVPILDAYEIEGNMIMPSANIANLDEFFAQEQHYRNRMNAINSLIHGNYGAMDKAEYSRYSLGRLLMYMKGWLGGQWLSRFGSRRMAYSAGIEFEGMYRTVFNAGKLLYGVKGNFAATGRLLTSAEKDNLVAATMDTAAITVMMAMAKLLAAAVYSDDDDDQDNLAVYWLLYNVLYLEDELSSLHPLFGSISMYYSRVQNNVDGKNIGEYLLNRNFVQPYRGVTDVLKSLWEFTVGDIDMFDEYVPRSKEGRVLNPKRYQKDPFLDGQPEVVARLNKLWALNNSVNYFYGGSEYLYRRYEYSNPKWFVPSYNDDKRQARKGVDAAKKEIKSIKTEMTYIEDPETIFSLQERIDKLQQTIDEGKEKEDILKKEYDYSSDRK